MARSSSSKHQVILVRTPTKPLEEDQYDRYFSSPEVSVDVHHLPILGTTWVNIDSLASLIQEGPNGKFSGVILTSGRSAEAWGKASFTNAKGNKERHSEWSQSPFFVVGQGTRDAVLRLTCPPCPQEKLLGADESGSGEKLAEYIVRHFTATSTTTSSSSSSSSPRSTKPLLYLVGDKNRDTIPKILSDAGLQAERFQVYETQPISGFEEDLKRTLAQVRESTSTNGAIWLALFSPAGAKHCIGVLRDLDLLPERDVKAQLDDHRYKPRTAAMGSDFQQAPMPSIRIAAIGPITQKYIEEDEGVPIHAVASSPEPRDLVQAILDRDK